MLTNPLTIALHSKGYTIQEYLNLIGRSLRWHRTHEIKGAAHYKYIVKFIDELESK